MSSPRTLNFSWGLNNIIDSQTKQFAKENNLTDTQADLCIWRAKQSKEYINYAMNNAKSSEPNLLERNKFAMLLAGKFLKDNKQTEINVARSINSISPM